MLAHWHLHWDQNISLLAHCTIVKHLFLILPMAPHVSNCHPYINKKSTLGSPHALSNVDLYSMRITDDTRMAFAGFNQTFASTCTNLPSWKGDLLYHKLSTIIEYLHLKNRRRKTTWYFCYLVTTFNVDISKIRFKEYMNSFSHVVD